MIKWLLVGLIALLVLVVGALLAVPMLLDTPAMQAYVQQTASHALGRPVKFGKVSISALPLPSVRLRQLEVAEDPAFGAGPFVTVGRGRLRIRLRPLLQGRVELADLTLDDARIHVVEDAGGRLNVATLGPSGAPAPTAPPPRVGGGRPSPATAGGVLLSRVRITNSAVEYQKLVASGTTPAPLTLDRIDVTLAQGTVGEPLKIAGSAQAPGGIKLTITEGTLSAAPGRSLTDGQVRATVDVEGHDVREAAAALVPAPSLSGPIKGRLQVSGTAAKLTATGAVAFERLTVAQSSPRCPDPKPRSLVLDDVRMPLLYTPAQLESQAVQTKAAKGTVAFHLVMALAPSRTVTLRDIQVKGLQLEPVLVDYLCQRDAVTGPLDLTGELSLRLPEGLPTLGGAGRLAIGAGRVVGPDLLNAVNRALALTDIVSAATGQGPRGRPGAGSPLNFDSITATYRIANGLLRTDDLLYVARDVRVTGAGTYGVADGRIAMDVTVAQGSNRVKARVAGGPGNLSIVPTDLRVKEPKDLRKTLDRLLR
jgi:AsmA protein